MRYLASQLLDMRKKIARSNRDYFISKVSHSLYNRKNAQVILSNVCIIDDVSIGADIEDVSKPVQYVLNAMRGQNTTEEGDINE